MIQAFCIPLAGSEDPDRASPRASARTHVAEPVQGWAQWAKGIEDIIGGCESEQAIDLVQERNRALLLALSCERQELYRELGARFGERRQVIRERSAERAPPSRRKQLTKLPSKSRTQAQEKVDA
jgi:hypothetical protein